MSLGYRNAIMDILSLFSFERWVLQAVAMALTAAVIPKLRVTSIAGPVLAVVALAFLNTHIWSAALFFQVPNSLTTQTGLLVIVNGVIFWILVKLLPGIEVDGVLPALVAPIVFTVLSVVVERYGTQVDWYKLAAQLLEFVGQLKDYFMAPEASAPPVPAPIPSG